MCKNNLITTPELFIENVNLYYSTLLTRISMAVDMDKMVLDKPTVQFHRDSLFSIIFHENYVTRDQLSSCSFEQLKSIGFVEWSNNEDKSLMLIPLRLKHILDPEMLITTTKGETMLLKAVKPLTGYGVVDAGIYIEHSDKE